MHISFESETNSEISSKMFIPPIAKTRSVIIKEKILKNLSQQEKKELDNILNCLFIFYNRLDLTLVPKKTKQNYVY